MNRRYIPLIILSLIIGVLLFSPVARFYIHALTNVVIGGRSTTKVFAVLIYLFILFLLTFFKNKIHTPQNVQKYFIYSLCILFGLSVNMVFVYGERYGIPLTDFSILFNNGEISSTVISHAHVTKGAVGTLLSYLGFTYFENIDAGHAFIGIIPKWVFIFESICIGTATILSFLVFLKRIKSGVRYQTIFTIFYGILTFSVLERSFDGGFFDFKTPITCAALLILVYGYTKWSRGIAGILSVLSITLLSLYAYMGMLGEASDIYASLWQLCGLSLFLILAIYVSEKGYTRLGILLSILFLIGSYMAFMDYSNSKEYMNIPLTTGTQIALVGDATYPNLIPLHTISHMTIYTVSQEEKGYVRDVINQQKLVPSMYPISVPWKTCFPYAPWNMYQFTVTSKEMIRTLTMKESVYAYTAKDIGRYNEYYRYDFTVSINQCTPRTLNVIEHILYSQGLTEFVISNISTKPYDIHS